MCKRYSRIRTIFVRIRKTVIRYKAVLLQPFTLRLVTIRNNFAQWKLALRYALPTANSLRLVYVGDPKENNKKNKKI